MEGIPGYPCEELRNKIQNNVFNLVVLGQFKRGKTSLINALLGAEVLPTAVVPLTSIATILNYGEALRISVDQPVSQAELDFLKDVREYSDRIFFLQNKADYVNGEALNESITFSKKVLKDAINSKDIKIFPISAKLALEGKFSGSEELLERSFLPEFEKILNDFLMKEKGKVLISSVTNTLLRILSQTMLELEIEIKSLLTPLEELRVKIDTFEERKKDVLIEKRDFDILLDGEVDRIVKNIFEEDLEKFKRELTSELLSGLESLYKNSKGLSGKQLNKVLEEYIIDEVKNAYNNWRVKEDAKLASAFEALCSRFIGKINEIIDALLKFSSELFSISFEVFRSDELWDMKSSFYYKFKDEPVSLEFLTTSFTFALPRFISNKIIFKNAKEYMLEMIDKQAGRLRFDFIERLDKSKYKFRWEMLQKIEATIEGISSAINKGLTEKSKGEVTVSNRKKDLSKTVNHINKIKGRLLKLRQQVT